MTFKPTFARIWGVSLPLVIAGITETVVDVTDTLFLAWYGMVELAAIGVAAAVFGVLVFAATGIVDALQILIARRVGEGRATEVGRVFNQAVYLLLIASAVLIALVEAGLPAVAGALFESAAVGAAVADYMDVAVYGILFYGLNLAYGAFYVGISRARVLVTAAAILAVVNITLDYALIFGAWGFDEYGIRGAGMASLAAEAASFLFLTLDVLRRGYHRRYGLLRFGVWDRTVTARVVDIGLPVSMEVLVEAARWFVFFLILERMGASVLAAANIVFACYLVLLIPVDAFSDSVSAMASNVLGQRRRALLGAVIRRSMLLQLATVAGFLLLLFVVPGAVLALFTDEPALVEAARPALYVISLAVLVAVPAATYYATIAGTGDTRALLAIQTVVGVITLAAAWAIAFPGGGGLAAVWTAEVVGWLACLALSVWWYRSERWSRLAI